jgi:hypothetical protein
MSVRAFRSTVALALASVVFVSLGASAHAAESFSSQTLKADVSMDSTVISPTTRRVVGRITVQAGAKKIVVRISASSPHFRRMFKGELAPEGHTLRAVRLRSVGPTRQVLLDSSGGGSGYNDACAIPDTGPKQPKGGDWGGPLYRGLILKPRQSVTIEVDFDVSAEVPWFGTNYAPIFRVGPLNRDIGDGTKLYPKGMHMLKRDVTLSPPRPTVVGPFAARIDISNTGDVFSKERGVVRGSLIPAQAGRTINFAALREKNWPAYPGDPILIGSTVTAADGSFSFSNPVLSNKGYYWIMPSYPAQAGDLLPDSPCAFTYIGTKPQTPPFTP